jgi:hypothetical protein
MRKLLALFIIVISLLTLLTAMNQVFINRVKQDRYFDHLTPDSAKATSLYNRVFIRSDRWGYGDLYGICYLPQYRIKLTPFKAYNNQPANKTTTNRVLYIIGDSFTADKVLYNDFTGFDNVVFLDRRFPFGPVQVDTSKQNYLIMQFSELNISTYNNKKTTEIAGPSGAPVAFVPASMISRLGKIIFNKDLNKNLELLLFDDKLFTGLKHLKASFNYNILGRLPKEVAISTDKKRLLLNSTVDINSPQSVFKPRSEAQVDTLLRYLTEDQKRYQSLGFKKVFLSLTPNAVSIYDSSRGPYNHLIERIENKTSIPVISVFNTFKNSKKNLYSRSDAHWNPDGFEIWVNETNKVLKANIN